MCKGQRLRRLNGSPLSVRDDFQKTRSTFWQRSFPSWKPQPAAPYASFSAVKTHEKAVNAVNKRARDVEPQVFILSVSDWGEFQQRGRQRGEEECILHPLLSRESHHESSTKSSEPQAQGPFSSKLREQHWGNSAIQQVTAGTVPPDLSSFHVLKENKEFNSEIRQMMVKLIQRSSSHPIRKHDGELMEAAILWVCGNLTLNGLHKPPQPSTNAHTNQSNYNLSFLFCPFHCAPF